MTKIGDPAPNFSLPDHTGDTIELNQYRGNRNVVLSFHIFSFTGGWTHQVSSFRIHSGAFEEIDTQVLGISCDARPTQTAFASSLGSIPYPILADFHPHGEVCKQYGVYDETKGTPIRAVVIIDKLGILRFKKLYSSATELNPNDILAELAKL